MVNQKKTKILYVITKSVWGGAGKYVYDLATGLPKNEWEVFVATGGEGPLVQELKKENVACFNIKNFQRDVNILKEFLAGFEILKLLFKIKPNIIHTSSSKAAGITSIATFIYSFCSLLIDHYSLLKIFTVHGWAFHEDRPKRQIFLIKLFSKITCIFYNKIICVSEFDRQSAIKNKIAPTKKLITIHNGIKPEDYHFLTKEQARQKIVVNHQLPTANRNLWVGTIGEDTKNKGHKYLKKALKDAIIISNLPQGFNYLKAFDIFVLPSIKEGFPYILLEAGLARLPVVATNIGGVPEIIITPSKKPGVIPTGLLVEPKNSKQIREAVEKLIENSELKNEIAYNLWQKTLREFVFEKMLRATLATYQINTKTGKNR